MKISAKVQYACIAVLELAAHYGTGQPVQVGRIADENGIPPGFLAQILLQLKAAGLVASVRGAAGGYRLQRPPKEISLAAVVSVVDGQEEMSAATAGASPAARVLLEQWHDLALAQRAMLEGTTFADLADRLSRHREPMFYI